MFAIQVENSKSSSQDVHLPDQAPQTTDPSPGPSTTLPADTPPAASSWPGSSPCPVPPRPATPTSLAEPSNVAKSESQPQLLPSPDLPPSTKHHNKQVQPTRTVGFKVASKSQTRQSPAPQRSTPAPYSSRLQMPPRPPNPPATPAPGTKEESASSSKAADKATMQRAHSACGDGGKSIESCVRGDHAGPSGLPIASSASSPGPAETLAALARSVPAPGGEVLEPALPARGRDPRRGKDSVDTNDEEAAARRREAGQAGKGEKRVERGARDEVEVEEVGFSCGNPRVEHVTGVVRLFREIPRHGEGGGVGLSGLPQKRSTMVCALAMPGVMGISEFFQAIRPYLPHMRTTRVLRKEPSEVSVSMVVMSFDTQASADGFYLDYNGRALSSLLPDVLLKLLFVSTVEVLQGQGSGLPPSGFTELPSCPVCLERLDSQVSGVVTTVCNHQFHSECLQQWGDTSCPVCRYAMEPSHTSSCERCSAGADLWVCLICGHVGCGRYREAHAVAHFQHSAHCFALEVETGRVWDYVGDGYVHRLVQEMADGKLVEVPQQGREGQAVETGGPAARWAEAEAEEKEAKQKDEAVLASKLDAITAEYNHLLVSQLDSQRQYFEQQMAVMRAEAAEKVAEATARAEAAAASTSRAADASRLASLTAHKQNLERKVADAKAQVSEATKEAALLRELNDQLLQNAKLYKQKAEEVTQKLEQAQVAHTAEVKELQEQLRDVMIALEAQQLSGSSELAGGSVLPLPQAQAPQQKGRKKKK